MRPQQQRPQHDDRGKRTPIDSGNSDGSNSQEAARLANFDVGGNENPTGAQAAPTPRAEQGATNLDDPKSPLSIVGGGSLAAILGINPPALQTPQLLPDDGSIPDHGTLKDLLERPTGDAARAPGDFGMCRRWRRGQAISVRVVPVPAPDADAPGARIDRPVTVRR